MRRTWLAILAAAVLAAGAACGGDDDMPQGQGPEPEGAGNEAVIASIEETEAVRDAMVAHLLANGWVDTGEENYAQAVDHGLPTILAHPDVDDCQIDTVWVDVEEGTYVTGGEILMDPSGRVWLSPSQNSACMTAAAEALDSFDADAAVSD